MHIDDDINFNLNPGDVGDGSPVGYCFFPPERFDLTCAELSAQRRTLKLVPSLMNRLTNDIVDYSLMDKNTLIIWQNTAWGEEKIIRGGVIFFLVLFKVSVEFHCQIELKHVILQKQV